MKTTILYAVGTVCAVALFTLTACGGNNTQNAKKEEPATAVADAAHNSRNALDYEGTYTGILPCADCPGIYTEITLKGDQFSKRTVYQGEPAEANTFEISGKYSWNEQGSVIILDNEASEQYQVGENRLFVLDADGKRITGELAELYILHKK